MVAGLELGNANELIGERFTDEDELAFPFDFARAADTADLVIGVIPGVFLAIRHRAPGAGVYLCRRRLIVGLVRTLFVEMAAKGIKTGLLFWPVRCRRLRGLRLQGAMHTFMPTVLLW